MIVDNSLRVASKNRTPQTRIYARVKMGDAIGIHVGDKVIVLQPPTAWKRYKTDNPDWKPQGSVPSFQSRDGKI